MIITHSIHIQPLHSYSSLNSIHHIQSSHNQSVHLIIQIIHSRDSNQFLSFHITINQTLILILSSFIPQFGSPNTTFPISPFYSTLPKPTVSIYIYTLVSYQFCSYLIINHRPFSLLNQFVIISLILIH